MIKACTFFFFIFFTNLIYSQAIFKKIYSEELREEREIKILLPRGYSEKNKKAYPVIYVFDGDYLFEPVAGNVDYLSYWDSIPDAIVVGINQRESREKDCLYNEQNSFPFEEGADFFNFVASELVPFIDDTFKTELFTVAVGHGFTANFINYFLLKEGRPLFNGYITLSPDLAPQMTAYLKKSLSTIEHQVFYYLATSNNDVPYIKENTVALDNILKEINHKKFLYSFNNFEKLSHYSLPVYAIPKALENIFFIYGSITKKEYETTILKLETSPVDYLKEKYNMIENFFGIKKQIIPNDIRAIEAAIEKKEMPVYYQDLGEYLRKQQPETLLGHYYLGKYYEAVGKPKKAIKMYQSAYMLSEVEGYNREDMLNKADTLKAEFGY